MKLSVLWGSCLILAIVLVMPSRLNSQTVGISFGVGITDFIDFSKRYYQEEVAYINGSNHFIKIDFNSYLPEAKFIGLSLKLERSVGSIFTQTQPFYFCGFMPNRQFTAIDLNDEFTLYRMSAGISPINFEVYKGIRLINGIELSRIFKYNQNIASDFDNSKDNIILARSSENDLIKNIGMGTFIEIQFGSFKINNHLFVTPIYHGSISFLDEIETNFNTKTIRHSFGFTFKSEMNN